jgi:hypothetical protein
VATSLEDLHTPIVVELDKQSFGSYLGSTALWLDHVLMLQSAFLHMADRVRRRVREPEFKRLLAEIVSAAKRHELAAEGLYEVVGREPSCVRKPLGMALATVRRGWASLLGGASAPWRDLQELYHFSLEAMSAFATAEQLGYSLGLPEIANVCFEVVAEKHTHHLVLQELTLESVPGGLLYKTPI